MEFQLQHHSIQRNSRVDLLQNGLVGSPCSPRDSQESSPTPQLKSITSWQIDGETVADFIFFIFLGSKITADGDCSHEVKRRLLLGRKVLTNLDHILKSRGIILPTKVHLVKAMIFQYFLSAQFNSVAQPCPTLCDPMNCSTQGFPVIHQLLEFTQTHVH